MYNILSVFRIPILTYYKFLSSFIFYKRDTQTKCKEEKAIVKNNNFSKYLNINWYKFDENNWYKIDSAKLP